MNNCVERGPKGQGRSKESGHEAIMIVEREVMVAGLQVVTVEVGK